MMKKYAISTFTLLFISFLSPNVYRIYNNSSIKMVRPFLLSKEEISIAWYLKDCGELLSFTCLVLVVCLLLNLIEKKVEEPYEVIFFINLWQVVFWVIFYSSILDLAHYVMAFKQIQWFFLIQSGLFLLISCNTICKAYKQ